MESSRLVHMDDWLNLRGLALTLALCYSVYWYLSRRKQNQENDAFAAEHKCEPVRTTLPYRWPLALDLLKAQYDALPEKRLLEFQTKYVTVAPTVRVDIIAEGYITTDPANIDTVIRTRFEDYGLGTRRLGLYPLLGEGIFTQDGSAWKHSRELLRRQFVRVHEAGLSALSPHIRDLLSTIEQQEQASSAGVVDLQPFFFEYTLGTTTGLLFGEPHSSLPKFERDALRDNFDYASMISAMRLRLAELAVLYKPAAFRKACKGVRDWARFFADKALDYMEQEGEEAASKKYGFIVDLWKDVRDRDVVRDQLLHVLIAGRDTTACLLSWTFFHLVRNPDMIDRIKSEIAKVIPADGQDITRAQIQQLPFLRCCLNETLRLYPQLPINVRFATCNTVLPRGGGSDGNAPMMLRKGQGIGWSAYHLHRSESLYGPDARVYQPQRWENGELLRKVGLGSGFLDFHGGPRVCLGKDYALMEASLAIVRILQTYPNIRLPPSEPNGPVGSEKQNLTIVLSSAEGTKVLLR